MPRGRPKNPVVTIAECYGLISYIGPPCKHHPKAIYCVRDLLSGHCIVSHRNYMNIFYATHPGEYARRMRERRAKQRWLRERYQEGWRKSRETMAIPQWKWQRSVKKFREFLTSNIVK